MSRILDAVLAVIISYFHGETFVAKPSAPFFTPHVMFPLSSSDLKVKEALG
jgi:hypothetical protein